MNPAVAETEPVTLALPVMVKLPAMVTASNVEAPSTFKPACISAAPVAVKAAVEVAPAFNTPSVEVPVTPNVPLTSALPFKSRLPSIVVPSKVDAPTTFKPACMSAAPVAVKEVVVVA